MQLKRRVVGAVGRIEKYAAALPPQNTIKANGAELSRVLFWRLWKHAQVSGNLVDQASKQAGNYGTGDGSTTFTIPDHRGVASRGFDDGAGLDSAPTLGRYQADANREHTHGMSADGAHTHYVTNIMGQAGTSYAASYTAGIANTVGGSLNQGTSSSGNHLHTISNDGNTEATMKNVSFMYCIRYQ